MGRPGITYADVANAASQLAGKGQVPTIEAIRHLIKTGSSSTIAGHLRTWKAKQTDTQALALKETLPEPMVALMKGLWERLVEESDAKMIVLKQHTEQYQRDAKQQIQTLQQESTQVQQHLQQVKQEKEALAQEKHVLETLLVSAQTEKNTLEMQQQGLLQQLQTQQDRITDLQHLHHQTQTNLEHYREAAREQRLLDQAQHEQQEKILELTITELRQTLSTINDEHKIIQQQYTQLLSEKNYLSQQMEALTKRYEAAQLQVAHTQQDMAQHQHWKSQYENLLKKEAQQQDSITELEKTVALISQELTMSKEEVSSLTSKNQLLAHEKWTLGQEKAMLQGQLKQLHSVIVRE